MANGFPIACLAGKRELMESVARLQVNHSGTYNSNVMATAAACATISELERISYQRLHELGEESDDGLARFWRRAWASPRWRRALARCSTWRSLSATASSITVAVWRSIKARNREFVGQMLDSGIRLLSRGLWYLSTAHTHADVEIALKAAARVWGADD